MVQYSQLRAALRIELDSKCCAEAMVAAGKVQVDGRDELRKTCKIRPGQVVAVHGVRVRVVGATANDDAGAPPA